MRNCFFTLSICLLTLGAAAQTSDNYLSLSGGLALPVGKFASTNTSDPGAGFGKMGGLLDLSYTRPTKESVFGLSALLRARINPVNSKAVIYPQPQDNPGFDWSGVNKSWKTFAAMVGGYASQALTKKISLEETFLLGIADATIPAYTTTAVKSLNDFAGDADVWFVSTPKSHALTFSSLFKLGASFQINSRLYLLVGLDDWYLKPSFGNLPYTVTMVNGLNVPYLYTLSNSRNPLVRDDYSEKKVQNMSSINGTLGVRVRL